MALFAGNTALAEEVCFPERSMVLVASADGPTRVAVARMIARLGLTTVVSLDGEAALIAIHNHEHSLLGAVLDTRLPILSGWDVARTLQAEIVDLPLVVLDHADTVFHYQTMADVMILPGDDLHALTAALSRLIETWTISEAIVCDL